MLLVKHRTIFVHVPKTGGSSVTLALKPHRDMRGILVRRTNKCFASLGVDYRLTGIDTITHATAKDYAKHLESEFSNYFSFAIVRNPFDWMVSKYHFKLKRVDTRGSFRQFVQNHTVKHQTDYITDDDGTIMVSFLGRFERLAEDFVTITEKIGLDLQLPNVNATDHKHFSSYYDAETEALVAQHYKKDFEILGYKLQLNT